jgi:hypothetical protein
MDGATPPSDHPSELAFAVHCDERTLRRKFVALQAHRSQTSELIRLLGPERYRQWWSISLLCYRGGAHSHAVNRSIAAKALQ